MRYNAGLMILSFGALMVMINYKRHVTHTSQTSRKLLSGLIGMHSKWTVLANGLNRDQLLLRMAYLITGINNCICDITTFEYIGNESEPYLSEE